jgi:hypothetical protein
MVCAGPAAGAHRHGSGLIFGLAFGMAARQQCCDLADHIGIALVYQICAFLPLFGLLAALLPDVRIRACGGLISSRDEASFRSPAR